jgi:hypothetical protein
MATKIDEEQLMNDMLSRVRAVNKMPQDIRATLLDFKVDGYKVGKVSRAAYTCAFCIISSHSLLSLRTSTRTSNTITGPTFNRQNAVQYENVGI